MITDPAATIQILGPAGERAPEPASAGRRFLAWAILLLVAATLLITGLIRGPYYDAAIFTVVGEQLARGELPYRDAWDHKPPGIYVVAAAGSLLPGPTWPWVWGASVLALAGTGALLSKVVNTHTALIATVSMGLWVVALGGGQTETFATLPAAGAFVAATRGRHLTAGALGALALLFSLQVAGLGAALLILARRRVWETVVGALAVGGSAVLLMTISGALPAAIDILVHYNSVYLRSDRTGDLHDAWTLLIAILPLGAVVPLRGRFDRVAWAAAAWFLMAVALMLIQGRLISHYAIVLLPPLAVVAGPALRRRDGKLISTGLLAASLVLSSYNAYLNGQREATVGRIGAAIATQTNADDPILQWGGEAGIYLAASRMPAGPYIYLMPLVTHDYSSPAMVEAWVSDLRREPPAMIIDAEAANPYWEDGDDFFKPPPPGAAGGRDLDIVEPFRDFVRSEYKLWAEIDGRKLYRHLADEP